MALAGEPAGRARAPAAGLVAQADAARLHVEGCTVARDASIEVGARLLHEPVLQTARGVLQAARDQQPW